MGGKPNASKRNRSKKEHQKTELDQKQLRENGSGSGTNTRRRRSIRGKTPYMRKENSKEDDEGKHEGKVYVLEIKTKEKRKVQLIK